MTNDYTPDFYERIRGGCILSADKVAPAVVERIVCDTVLDVGCGEGWWAKKFEELGATVTGYDGGYVTPVIDDFHAVDLAAERIPTDRTFDLAVCLEVAEHLPYQSAIQLVEDLSTVARNAILFSAAIPGQGGAGHINEQWQSYWAAHFERLGWNVSQVLSRQFWDDFTVEPWYRQNLLLCTRAIIDQDPILDVVHPMIWSWKVPDALG